MAKSSPNVGFRIYCSVKTSPKTRIGLTLQNAVGHAVTKYHGHTAGKTPSVTKIVAIKLSKEIFLNAAQ